MITSFEVGAVFRIINEASPQLTKILRQIRELQGAIDKAKLNLDGIAKAPLAAVIGETRDLAVAWREVAKAASSANKSIGAASRKSLAGPGAAGVAEAQSLASAWERIAAASAAAAGSGRALTAAAGRGPGGGSGVPGAGGVGSGGGGGGRHQPGWLRSHIRGPGVSVPGGGHISFAGGAAATAGLLGYGAYEAAQMEDAVWQLIYHSGLEQNDTNRARFRKILQDSMAESGYGLHDISESAKQEIRMFQGTKGGGLDVLPEMLRAATIEARLKGESPEESMKALIGLAHMTKQYDPAAIKKLAPAFAFLSTANPSSLSSIERAAGYAVPLLQSGLDVDPLDALLMGTALTRAGATSTKSGTWLRQMALRAMPGSDYQSRKAFEAHEAALRDFGLVDEKGKPTWFTKGKPDLFKMLDLASANANKIPLDRRAADEYALFGAQGGGGFALLSDPAVLQQVMALRGEMNSSEFKNRYGGFVQAYQQGSTVQQARTAMADFNNVMMDLGAHTLPAVSGALKDFKGVLESLKSVIPGGSSGGSTIGTRAIEGALGGAAIGAGIGAFGGPIGVAGGAVLGGVAGVAEGFMESYAKEAGKKQAEQDKSASEGQRQARDQVTQSLKAGAMPPINFSLNIDGRAIAQAIIDKLGDLYRYDTSTAAPNGATIYGP